MKATKFALTVLGIVTVMFIGCGGGGGGGDESTPATTQPETTQPETSTGQTQTPQTEETTTEEETQQTTETTTETTTTVVTPVSTKGIIIDHNTDTIADIPAEYINRAKENLHIIYQGASHSRQMSKGMEAFESATGIKGRKGDIYGVDLSGNGANGELDMKENFGGYWSSITNAASLYSSTSAYLDANPKVNVVFWMWCYQRDDWNGAGTEYETNIARYISEMEKLISEYGEGGSKVSSSRPAVTFVYATGPNMMDKAGTTENENKIVFDYNKQIRDHAKANNRVLFDYNDIESYSPEEVYYGDGDASASDVYSNYTHANDLQDNYYGFGNSRTNWAQAWQDTHTEGVDYFNFVTEGGVIEHSNAIDADRKVYAMWWLFARLAGWDGQ